MLTTWFYLRHRGQPPRVFIIDNYFDIIKDIKIRINLDNSFKDLSLILNSGLEPKGLRSKKDFFERNAVYKGFSFPKEKEKSIIDMLISNLGLPGIKPSNIIIPGYFGAPPGKLER